MEKQEKPDNIIDGDVLGLIVGIGLAFMAGNYAKDNFVEANYIAASADSLALIFAATGAGVALRHIIRRNDGQSD